jgi:enoyl-CoA hydratase
MSILYEKKDRIAYLTLNRPEAMNAIDRDMFQGIQWAINDFRDDNDAWVMLITGAGDKAFSTGVDMKSTMAELQEGTIELVRTRWFEGVYKPVVAAINGFCFAGALEMVLYTDIRIASDNAVLGLTEAKWGVSPCDGAITRLAYQVSWCHLMELFAVADPITAHDAYRMGLVNLVVPSGELMSTAKKIAHRIAANAPLAVRNIKEVASRALSMPMDQALILEHCMGSRIMATEDAQEGPRAFAEKRKPQYKCR